MDTIHSMQALTDALVDDEKVLLAKRKIIAILGDLPTDDTRQRVIGALIAPGNGRRQPRLLSDEELATLVPGVQLPHRPVHAPKPHTMRRGEYICEIRGCGRRFVLAAHLARHVSATHGRKA